MRSIWEKWKITIIIAIVTSFSVAAPAFARWSDQTLLPSLASYNIFGLTRDLVGQTDEMLHDTKQLQNEVAQASDTLDALDKQNQLLSSQIQTNRSIQSELNQQLAGNVKARELMKQILDREEKTYSFTKKVAAQANQITVQMNTSVNQLGHVAENTGAIGENTRKLNGQMDDLLVQLDQSVKNFRFIARITDALSYLEKKTGLDLPVPRQPNDDKKNGTPLLPLPEKPVEGILDSLLPNKKEPNRAEEDKGLLDLLLP
ncbi:hypothetical protein ACFO25_18815 [Paenactinomyces guangxiensis]|uniref:Uncharacterized protein n=1 Tax=Paenactinomyces guangxiensis TaxID=1490290 RepID=A0A7W1WR12_9BACL|nr:hypothetical protein [Paenactinomyces guangxiensis]MBA4494499.1 hypothetical protein [Paenactinomyces guangxiensis]MBH8591446.1 hypothetical protein [Paenactinomyces guangxiensis]